MTFDAVRGTYFPSYFRIRLNTEEELNHLEKLPEKDQSTFFHEYFHFLQDITSEFGYNCAWNAYDRIRQIITHYQKIDGDILIKKGGSKPVPEIEAHFKLFIAQLVDKKPTPEILFKEQLPTISSYRVTSHHDFIKMETDTGIKFIQLALTNKEGNKATYWFGGMAVIETMTHLIQKKFFPQIQHPDFPYLAGIHFAKHLSNKVSDNEEYIFALCDLALQTPYPGQTFLELILEIDKWDAIKNTEEIYAFGLDYISKKWRSSDALKNLMGILAQIYGHETLKYDKEWLLYILEAGSSTRKQDPQIMLNLYRSKSPFGDKFYEVYKLVGAPEIINSNGKRWFAPPQRLMENNGKIQTVFLSVFQQFHSLFVLGNVECGLKKHCLGSDQKMPVDELCNTSPWLKVKQDPLCPFAAIWVVFGLHNKNVVLK